MTLRITLEPAKDGDDLSFVITDNGAGIDPEKQYLLFKPFSQVRSSVLLSYSALVYGALSSLVTVL